MYELVNYGKNDYDLPYKWKFEENNIGNINCLNDDILNFDFVSDVRKADRLDYSIAAASGLLSATFNQLWLGKFSLTEAHSWGKNKLEKFVIYVAKLTEFKGNDIKSAIAHLEKNFHIPGDVVMNDFGGGLQHHLRDFTHHPTIVGLFFSILSQFTGKGFGTDTNGNFIIVDIPSDKYIGKDIAEKILFGTVYWGLHLISDMCGSSTSLSEGTGIPGVLLSFFKELSVLPIVKDLKVKYKDGEDIEISKSISKLFNGTHYYLNEDGVRVRFDLRTEVGLLNNMAKSSIPVLANEVVVRSFYFIRKLFVEIKEKEIQKFSDLNRINLDAILPHNSRELTRMLSVSSGIFMVVTTGSTIVKAMVKNKDNKVGLAQDIVLNINYAGIGRFTVAIAKDSKYFVKDFNDLKKAYLSKQYARYETVNFNSLDCFSLNYNETRILYSLKYQKIKYDVLLTKNEKDKINKESWLNDWKQIVLDGMNIKDSNFFIDDEFELYKLFVEEKEISDNDIWIKLVFLETYLFKPYGFIDEVDNSKYHKLKLKSDYIKDKFYIYQDAISQEYCDELIDEYENSIKKMKDTKKKVIIGASAAVITTAFSGGMAWFFAPQIAVLIAGSSFASLSGASLTSASLALLGGGSLATGGLGMAGGTALITGGGALLGMTGSTAMTTLAMGSSNVYTLNECAKIMTFSKKILLEENNDIQSIKNIQKLIIKKIYDTNIEIDSLLNSDQKNDMKDYIKNCKKSIFYLQKCSDYLETLIDRT